MYGIYIVIFGWLLNIPLLFLIYFLVAKPICKRVNGNCSRKKRLLLSGTTLVAAILATYIPGWLHFNKLCSEHATPLIGSVKGVNHYYIQEVNPNGPFLELDRIKKQFEDNRISFIEGPNIFRTKHRPNKAPYLRYHLTDEGKFEYHEIDKRESRFGFRRRFNNEGGLYSHVDEVYRIKDNSIISQETELRYHGGYLSWLTFPFGIRECSNYDRRSHVRLDLRTFNIQ